MVPTQAETTVWRLKGISFKTFFDIMQILHLFLSFLIQKDHLKTKFNVEDIWHIIFQDY